MNRKFALLAALLILLIGGVITAITLSGEAPENDSAEAGSASTRPPSGASSTPRFQPDTSGAGSETDAKASERERRRSELVETYGESRANLARHVSENVVSLLDDALAMGDMMIDSERFGGGERQLRGITEEAGIELTEDQQETASDLVADFYQRRLGETRSAVDSLRGDPTKLMGLVLAGDARARDELTEAEYNALQQANADALGDIMNPLDRDSFRPQDPMEDEAFRSGFESILDAEQSEKLAAARDEEQGAEEEPDDRGDITDLPVMDLEQLDSAISSTKQIMSGARQAMEGMRNLGPIQEQLRRDREPRENEE